MAVLCQMTVMLLFFWTMGAVVGPHGGKMKIGYFVGRVILEIKITVFIFLLDSEGCDSLPKHLDLALAPNKTNEGVKKK